MAVRDRGAGTSCGDPWSLSRRIVLTEPQSAAQVEYATRASTSDRRFLKSKEIDMDPNDVIELGAVTEETKQIGVKRPDNEVDPDGNEPL
jgi:hypothetical protein